MKKFGVAMLPLLLVLALALVACGKQPGGGNTGPSSTAAQQVTMDATDFLSTAITAKAGQEFKFVDPSDTGGIHTICTGSNGTCQTDANAPQDLQGKGFDIQAGETKAVTFDKPGTYKITCSIHPNMNLTLTVQ